MPQMVQKEGKQRNAEQGPARRGTEKSTRPQRNRSGSSKKREDAGDYGCHHARLAHPRTEDS